MNIYIKDACIINEGKKTTASILIKEGIIESFIKDKDTFTPDSNTKVINASGKLLIPGVIDDQVHFREPGLTHKGDITSESTAAIIGGVTSYMEMPNTVPQSISLDILEEKYSMASEKSLANYSFYLGATNNNIDEVTKADPRNICGVKIFMGSSTGNMLVDNKKSLETIFSESPILIATHCEDENTILKNLAKYKSKYGDNIPIEAHYLIRNEDACYKSSALAVELATKYNSRLHVLHLSTKKELGLFNCNSERSDKRITNEVCVHHLWFDSDDYKKYGAKIKWNPAVKTKADKEGLLQGLLNGKVDVIATDHAPHLWEEKSGLYMKAASGGPMVQHSLLTMLELYKMNKISLETIVDKMCHAPADIFKINKRGYIKKGYWADIVLIDPKQKTLVNKESLKYKCKWSPLEGMEFSHAITHTIVNGELVFENGNIHNDIRGKRLLFKQ